MIYAYAISPTSVRKKCVTQILARLFTSFFRAWEYLYFFDKENILISGDTNYIQSLQQRNNLMAVWIHIDKKETKKKRPATVCQP
jgi:hypothetical protein